MSGDSVDPWATLDDLLGTEALPDHPTGTGIGRLAFYGRCSTEDNQDPKTSKAWQLGEAARFVEPLGGVVVEEFFDIGQSRSLPWERRDEASRALQALKNPNRGWDGLVVGEATRCWFGNQFSLTWPKFDRYGVSLWIPSLGGRFDAENTVHDMAMTITGGLSKSERQHVQRRVRAAMAAQVLIDGKHQGGRAPYGYQVVDAGPHPNPRKAQEGYRLRVLAVDEVAAPVVERIFALYLEGVGHKGIAQLLNAEHIPCPAAHTPHQNRHRAGDGWQGSTVRAILCNPRYTGYAIYGRWQKVEELLDPDDVAAGHVVRYRRSPSSKIVRSREPAHPAIVSVEAFTRVQFEMSARAGASMSERAQATRTRVASSHTYVLRRRIQCTICGRRMEGSHRSHATFYRCRARSLAPGSPALQDHPPNVYLREDHLTGKINAWIARLFDPAHVDSTVEALADADELADRIETQAKSFRRRIAAAESTMERLRRAIEVGWDPETLTEQYNAAAADKRAAESGLKAVDPLPQLTANDIRALVTQLGDMAKALDHADHKDLAELYEALGLAIAYDHRLQVAEVSITPALRGVKKCVRGGT
ncbi:recombinase family protein [Kribbella sp. VKM Ac-2566]|uniref:recombinase family protein n=1 Tax=Kribbella sp. VKM Ac-2566 TaxID=2512218 RepID=UPI0010637491|nr:recombinase family protein [Kribbella sp. VKM Ac-2566]